MGSRDRSSDPVNVHVNVNVAEKESSTDFADW
jgi:hypothetical protein